MSDTIWTEIVQRLDASPPPAEAIAVWGDAVRAVFPVAPDLVVDPGTFGPFDQGGSWWQMWSRAVVRADNMEAARVAAFRALQRIEAVSPSGEELDEEDYDFDQGMPWEVWEPQVLAGRYGVPADETGVERWVSSRDPQAWELGFDLRESFFPWVHVRALEILVEELRGARPGRVTLQPAPR